jgi:hypothetical protein
MPLGLTRILLGQKIKKNARGVEHNSKNGILNGYHMIEINHFKILLLCKMM